MNICPKCNSANVEYFIAGYCPACAGKVLEKLEAENKRLREAIEWAIERMDEEPAKEDLKQALKESNETRPDFV